MVVDIMDDNVFMRKKKDTLNRQDKSKKGSVDKDIQKLVDTINKSNSLYTTSSCSGRIVIIRKESSKKWECDWLFSSHEIVKDYQKVFKILEKLDILKDIDKGSIWFKYESTILHVCAKTLVDASLLLEVSHKSGFKRSGIVTIKKNIVVELMSTEKIESLVMDREGKYYDEESIRKNVEYGNLKLSLNLEKINKLQDLIKKYFK